MIPKTRGGMWWRFGLAAVLVIGFTAATTAVGGLLQFNQIAKYFSETPALKNADVKLPSPGAPETLLLIGSDHRAGEPYSASNTDTMMLVRIDDNSSTINLLSIPRDLKVQLPSGTAKLNAAYSEGGPNLLIKTLKSQVFPGLQVNHILDINFGGFSDLVNALGCVYADVDHRYYNDTALTNYSSIDVQPGYELLCGTPALQFVRFRHTDSDIVRNARQQDFIRWAKEQFSVGQLLGQENQLLQIFGAHVQTDHFLHTTDGLIDLFDLAINADGHTLKQIPFPAQFLPCGGGVGAQTPCYVTAGPDAMRVAYGRFMTPTVASTAHKAAGKPRKRAKASNSGLIADSSDGKNQALALGRMRLPVYFPTEILAGSEFCSDVTGNCDESPNPASEYAGMYPRSYNIQARDKTEYPSYRMTLEINSALGEYYGVQGTTWLHPPILNAASTAKNVNGKILHLYFNGAHLSLVAWRTPKALYWVSNTLADYIKNNQLVAIAASLDKVH